MGRTACLPAILLYDSITVAGSHPTDGPLFLPPLVPIQAPLSISIAERMALHCPSSFHPDVLHIKLQNAEEEARHIHFSLVQTEPTAVEISSLGAVSMISWY